MVFDILWFYLCQLLRSWHGPKQLYPQMQMVILFQNTPDHHHHLLQQKKIHGTHSKTDSYLTLSLYQIAIIGTTHQQGIGLVACRKSKEWQWLTPTVVLCKRNVSNYWWDSRRQCPIRNHSLQIHWWNTSQPPCLDDSHIRTLYMELAYSFTSSARNTRLCQHIWS